MGNWMKTSELIYTLRIAASSEDIVMKHLLLVEVRLQEYLDSTGDDYE